MNAAHAVGRLSEDRQSPLPKRLCMTPDEGAARHIRDLAMRFSLGWNVSLIIQSPPPKRLSMQALASSRTKRMKTKIRKKYGFFAEEFIAEELAAKPSYYRGFSAIFYDEWEEYEREWQSWPTPAEALGRMVVAGNTSEACGALAEAAAAYWKIAAYLAHLEGYVDSMNDLPEEEADPSPAKERNY